MNSHTAMIISTSAAAALYYGKFRQLYLIRSPAASSALPRFSVRRSAPKEHFSPQSYDGDGRRPAPLSVLTGARSPRLGAPGHLCRCVGPPFLSAASTGDGLSRGFHHGREMTSSLPSDLNA